MMIKRVVTGELKENCYILIKNNQCLIVDLGDDYLNIKKQVGLNKVLGVLLTHNHFDHVGAKDELINEYGVQTYSYYTLPEGEFNLGPFQFFVIYTPGHTSDSISFYFIEQKVMFTGDFLFKGSVGRWDLPTGDFEMMQNSISKIEKYDQDIVIYPGHGDSSTIGDEKNNNQYLFTN